jgi:hypothetical protein
MPPTVDWGIWIIPVTIRAFHTVCEVVAKPLSLDNAHVEPGSCHQFPGKVQRRNDAAILGDDTVISVLNIPASSLGAIA